MNLEKGAAHRIPVFLLVLCCAAGVHAAHATTGYSVRIDTTPWTGQAAQCVFDLSSTCRRIRRVLLGFGTSWHAFSSGPMERRFL